MKTKKRRITVLVSLLLMLTFVLSACGSNQSPANSNANEVQTTPAESGSTSVEETEKQTEEAEEAEEADGTQTADVSGRLKMTLNGTDVVYAELTNTPATAEFLEQLPFSIEMHEHLDRQKEVYLPFSLSEESQQNTVYEYEIGDIVYWHPGPTMGIFTEHDGRSISSGIEVLARMDEEGVAAFQAYDENVEVLFEFESEAGNSSDSAPVQGSRQLTITLDDTDVIYATLLDTPAADAFAEQLPLTLNMTDYANREKHAHLDFTIDDSDLENIQYPYEIGDIIYYPPGPTFAMYYDHDGREISAGIEVIARLDEEGIAVLGSYEAAVKVTVELSN